MANASQNIYTLQTNMEPENTPLEKQKHPQTTNFGFHVSFRGCNEYAMIAARMVWICVHVCTKLDT